jgi:hypothetical protein
MSKNDRIHLFLIATTNSITITAITASKPGVLGVGVGSSGFSGDVPPVIPGSEFPEGFEFPFVPELAPGVGVGVTLLGSTTVIFGLSELFTALVVPLYFTSV